MGIEIVGCEFAGRRRPGDFAWMIERDEYRDALFVFNDNEEQFLSYRRDPSGRSGCSAGGGNAVVRPYRCADPPRAAGIPTGVGGQGYRRLTDEVRAVVDDALSVVHDLVATGRYARVFYSASGPDGGLGTGIFDVADDVKRHIVAGLRALGDDAGR